VIIGRGLLATAFLSYSNNPNIVIFASGVSNSKNNEQSLFDREESLLRKTIESNKEKIIVYFSTCSIYDNSVNTTKYVYHKLKMENIIQENCSKFYIFRLPQVVGVTNSPTLIPFLFDSIEKKKNMIISSNSTRNIIAIEDVSEIVSYIIENENNKNEIINVATPFNTNIIEIIKKIEEILKNRAIYEKEDCGIEQSIDISKIKNLNKYFKIYNEKYVDDLLESYYQKRESQ